MRLHTRTARSIGLASAAALAALSLSACGSGGGGNAAANSAGSAFDTSVDASFDKSLHDSCVTSFTSKGGPADKAEPYCACVVKEADKLSTQDKLTLGMHQDKMEAMAQTCIAQITGPTAPASNAP
jgi:hypothetical protein